MNETKYAMVIDNQGYKVEFVLVEKIQLKDQIKEVPFNYKIKYDERLIFDNITVALSMKKPRWTGIEWMETITASELEALDTKTLQEYRQEKLLEISTMCQKAIYAGVDVETSQGIKHFSLTSEDQINMTNMVGMLEKAVAGLSSSVDLTKGVAYHADGELCQYWSVEDFEKISKEAISFITYQQTYCNHLSELVKRQTEKSAVKEITYGQELPVDLLQSLSEMIAR